MMTLPLAALLARSFGNLTRPLKDRQTDVLLKDLEDHRLTDVGLRRLDIEAMRRMW